jgi:FkbM family methyltransferase
MALRLLRFITNKASASLGRSFRFEYDFGAVLHKNFPKGAAFNLVLVGAHDGVSHDDLFSFLRDRKVRGIAIEPVPWYFELLQQNYAVFPGITCIQEAVHHQLREVVLYCPDPAYKHLYPEWTTGIASLDETHHQSKVDAAHMSAITAPAAPLMEMMGTYYREATIDLLQVDVEGYDDAVIGMFDFERFLPRIVKVEIESLSEAKSNAVKKTLQGKGYYIFVQGPDLIAVQTGNIKL